MSDVHRKSFLSAVFLFAIALSVAPAISVAQTSPCGCQDIPDLINLLNQDNAALNELEQYLTSANSTDLVNEILPNPNPSRQTRVGSISNAIRKAMDRVGNKQARTAGYDIDTVSCETRTRADTPCLKSIVDRRAAVHSGFCKRNKKDRGLGTNDDWMTFMPFKNYLLEEMDLYNGEISEILRRLGAMPKSCPLNDWFGTITVTETVFVHITNRTPGKNKYDKGTVEETGDFTERRGVVWLNGSSTSPLSLWAVEGSFKRNKVHEGLMGCKGGLATPGGETGFTSTVVDEDKKSGTRFATTSVYLGVSDDGREFQLSFSMPEMAMQVISTTTTTLSSGCPGASSSETRSVTVPDSSLNSQIVQATGQLFKSKPEKISGSQTIDMYAGQPSMPDITQSHKIVVSYSVYRFP